MRASRALLGMDYWKDYCNEIYGRNDFDLSGRAEKEFGGNIFVASGVNTIYANSDEDPWIDSACRKPDKALNQTEFFA